MDVGWLEPGSSLLEWELIAIGGQNYQCDNGLESEKSVWTHDYLNIEIDGYIYKWLCRYVYIHGLLYIHIFPCPSNWLPRSNNAPVIKSTQIPTLWFLILFFREKNQGFLEKWLTLGLGQ